MIPRQKVKIVRVAKAWATQHQLVFEKDVTSLIELLIAQRKEAQEDAREVALDRLMKRVQRELKDVHANTTAYKKSKEPIDSILYERGLVAEGTLKVVLEMITDVKQNMAMNERKQTIARLEKI